MSNPELDKMCTPFAVFEAPWQEVGKWGFWHVDHWVFYRTEAEAHNAATRLKQMYERRATPHPSHKVFEVDGVATYESDFVLEVSAETTHGAMILARTMVWEGDAAVSHSQLDMKEVSLKNVKLKS